MRFSLPSARQACSARSVASACPGLHHKSHRLSFIAMKASGPKPFHGLLLRPRPRVLLEVSSFRGFELEAGVGSWAFGFRV